MNDIKIEKILKFNMKMQIFHKETETYLTTLLIQDMEIKNNHIKEVLQYSSTTKFGRKIVVKHAISYTTDG